MLEDRWLPRGLAGGALLRRSFTVLESPSPPTTEANWLADDTEVMPLGASPQQPSPFSRPRLALAPPIAARPRFELTLDARLRRVWHEHTEQELLGIAGAMDRDGATVIAVTSRQVGAYESSRLEEGFKHYYSDGHVRLVSAVAESYQDVVHAWFTEVDNSHSRSISVQTDDNSTLLIRLVGDQPGRQDAVPEVSAGRHADRQALRALLPHERVEFVAAEDRLSRGD